MQQLQHALLSKSTAATLRDSSPLSPLSPLSLPSPVFRALCVCVVKTLVSYEKERSVMRGGEQDAAPALLSSLLSRPAAPPLSSSLVCLLSLSLSSVRSVSQQMCPLCVPLAFVSSFPRHTPASVKHLCSVLRTCAMRSEDIKWCTRRDRDQVSHGSHVLPLSLMTSTLSLAHHNALSSHTPFRQSWHIPDTISTPPPKERVRFERGHIKE